MNDSQSRRLRDRAGGPATLISEGCKITGMITGECDFQISGTIEGDCDLAGTVTLSPEGVWVGSIRAGNVIVAGQVEGDIDANGHVEITATAKISGTVSGQAIAVAEGAVVEGVMKTIGNIDPQTYVEKRQDD
ncbi:MAG: bactofilin family protein [Woeseiaceae bacterium]